MPSLSTFHFSSSPSPVHRQQAAPSTSTPSCTRDFLTTSAGDSTCPHKPPQLLRQARALVALLQLPVQDDAASPPPCCTHAGTSHSLVGLFDRYRFHFMNSHVFTQPATLHLSSKKQVSPATRMPIADDSNIPHFPSCQNGGFISFDAADRPQAATCHVISYNDTPTTTEYTTHPATLTKNRPGHP